MHRSGSRHTLLYALFCNTSSLYGLYGPLFAFT